MAVPLFCIYLYTPHLSLRFVQLCRHHDDTIKRHHAKCLGRITTDDASSRLVFSALLFSCCLKLRYPYLFDLLCVCARLVCCFVSGPLSSHHFRTARGELARALDFWRMSVSEIVRTKKITGVAGFTMLFI